MFYGFKQGRAIRGHGRSIFRGIGVKMIVEKKKVEEDDSKDRLINCRI